MDWQEQRRAWERRRRQGKPSGQLWPAKPRAEEQRRPVFGWRVWLLPLFFWPLAFELLVEMVRGGGRSLTGALLGLGLSWFGAALMAQGRRRKGAVLFGVAAGLSAGLSAGIPPPIAVALGFGAWFGVRLLTEDLPEIAPPPPPPQPEPAAVPGPLSASRAQLAHITEAAPGLPLAPLLLDAADAMRAVVDDIETRPTRLHEARRFLAVHLDGLSRIVVRLEAGAEPPPTLPSLLTDLTESARKLRDELRVAESEALDIQVKVLAERLRQEEP